MKTETAKPSEQKRREQNMCGFFHAKRRTQPGQVLLFRSSLRSYYGVCNHKKGGEEVAAVGASAFLLRSCCAARAQPPRTTPDARRARPLAAVAMPPSRCRRRLNRNPDLPSPRLPGTVAQSFSQIWRYSEYESIKLEFSNNLERNGQTSLFFFFLISLCCSSGNSQ